MKKTGVCVLLLLTLSTFAADIVWEVKPNTGRDADVRTDGKLLYAYAPQEAVVNSVRFKAVANGADFPADITFARPVNSIRGSYWHDPASAWRGGDEYRKFFANGFYSSHMAEKRQTVRLHGLKAGGRYMVQVWFCDMRDVRRHSCQYLGGKTLAMSGGGNYFGANAVGTFVASGDFQRFDLTSNIEDQINAIQVRDLDAGAARTVEIGPGADGHPLDRFNSVWTNDNLGVTYSARMPTAALLGNGSLGVVNGGVKSGKKFVLTRGDLWSSGRFEFGRGNNPERDAMPMSFADLTIETGDGEAHYTDTLDIATATLETYGTFAGNEVMLKSFVSAGEDVFVVSGVAARDACWKLRLALHDDVEAFPGRVFLLKDGIGVGRSTVGDAGGDPRAWVTNATALVKAVGAEIFRVSAASPKEAVAEVRVFAGERFAFAVLPSADATCSAASLGRIREKHLEWWREWWNRSRIFIGDHELEQYYYGSLYLLGSGVRKGKLPPGLYGIWVTTDIANSQNDYHLNYNYVATYYGCFAANRPEIAYNMPDPLLDYLPLAEKNARENLRELERSRFRKSDVTYVRDRADLAGGIPDAALFPVALGPWGCSPAGDTQFWCQTMNGPFSMAQACTYWEYTLDREYLKKVWPLLDKVANFYLSWCEKEPLPGGGYRYVLWDSWCEDFGLRKNCGITLGLVRYLFETLVSVEPHLRELGIDVSAEKSARWRDLLANLSPLPMGLVKTPDGVERTVFSNYETGTGRAMFVCGGGFEVESVMPGEAFAFDAPPEYKKAAYNTVAAKISYPDGLTWHSDNQTTRLYAIAMRAGYPPEGVIDAFKKYEIRRRGNRNYTLNDNHHGMEKAGAIEFINSMLIQSDHGFVKVFPNWTGKDAAFENLRAKGAFTVSAEFAGGKVRRVAVKSERGGRFRLVDPFAGGFAAGDGTVRGRTRYSGEATIEFDMRPGEVRELVDGGFKGKLRKIEPWR